MRPPPLPALGRQGGATLAPREENIIVAVQSVGTKVSTVFSEVSGSLK